MLLIGNFSVQNKQQIILTYIVHFWTNRSIVKNINARTPREQNLQQLVHQVTNVLAMIEISI
jgi:hypothetical protein